MKKNRRIEGVRQWLIFSAIVLALGGGILWYFLRPQTPEQKVENVRELPTPNFEIKEYSLSGEVTAISGNEITFNVGRLIVGENGQNTLIHASKTAILTNTAIINRLVKSGNNYVRKTGTLSDLEPGMDISVFSNTNIATEDSFIPTRIEYIK